MINTPYAKKKYMKINVLRELQIKVLGEDGVKKWYKEQYEETRKKIEKENKGCDGEEGCC